jgi:phospholipase C
VKKHKILAVCLSLLATIVVMFSATAASASTLTQAAHGEERPKTTTPIKHLVVIFDENVSFDHYFGTYPNATNPAGEPGFKAAPGTPSVNGLTGELLTNNPNLDNPQRLDRSQALTCDQDHTYTDEQKADDSGLMDKFVQSVSGGSCTDKSIVMDYYDGNTVTGLWNYAQNYALSDNSFDTMFGPSTPGALNLISGETQGATVTGGTTHNVVNGNDIGDLDPTYDACSAKSATLAMSGQNVGDLLNAQNLTWGWFEGGFTPTSAAGASVVCGSTHQNVGGATVTDYIPHHEPFQYYQSTSNPQHLPPSSVWKIGQTDQANHQYDLSSFWTAFGNGYLPAVSFLKAPAYQDGHAGYSDPLDEQTFLVNTINKLEKSKFWNDTAVVVSYDDSDGWYDHVLGPIVSQSNDSVDALTGPGSCGVAKTSATLDRCGYGPRLPLLVISRFAKQNFVDHSVTDQTSILRFIEDNWKLGRISNSFDALAGSLNNMFDFDEARAGKLILNPQTGERV